jgi:hypothetical protein
MKVVDLQEVAACRRRLAALALAHPELVSADADVDGWIDTLREAGMKDDTGPTRPLALRLDDETLAAVDAYAASLEAAMPGARVTRSAALRVLIAKGLKAPADKPAKRR